MTAVMAPRIAAEPAASPTAEAKPELATAPKIADEPAEERGLTRDNVRLLVATRHDDALVDAVFRDLPDFVAAGDLLVVNTSATVAAAVPTTDDRLVHFSTELPGGLWVVEVRTPCGAGSVPHRDAHDGETISLAGGGAVRAAEHLPGRRAAAAVGRTSPGVRDGARLPGPPRPAHPVRLHRAVVPARGLPDRVRRGAGECGDAERRRVASPRSSSPAS